MPRSRRWWYPKLWSNCVFCGYAGVTPVRSAAKQSKYRGTLLNIWRYMLERPHVVTIPPHTSTTCHYLMHVMHVDFGKQECGQAMANRMAV